MLWFLDLARQAGLIVESYADDAVAEMGRVGPGKVAIVKIILHPRIAFAGPAPDAATLDRLHHEAHERCFIANSLNCEIAIEA
jgi:organic hydroperoxide reductase OsmC/OhrA